MGASGYRDHIVVCGWNSTARDLIDELRGDDFKARSSSSPRSTRTPPATGSISFGATRPTGRPRAGRHQGGGGGARLPEGGHERRRHALDPDGHGHRIDRARRPDRGRGQQPAPRRPLPASPRRRGPRHLAAGLAPAGPFGALSGPAELVTDIVSGGEGSELYRISIPDEYVGLSIDEVAARLRRDHHATLLSVNRGGRAFVNPSADFAVAWRRRDRRGRVSRRPRPATYITHAAPAPGIRPRRSTRAPTATYRAP